MREPVTCWTKLETMKSNTNINVDTSRWHDIDWLECQQKVQHLQYKIVVAFNKGEIGEVKQLQHNLTKSFAARALAVRAVSNNPGSKTPGVDNVVWQTPTEKWNAILELGLQSTQSSIVLESLQTTKRALFDESGSLKTDCNL
uniref:Hypothetical reverse transcriptase n=1 Tax=Bracteacoccus minor TaxID=50037 RepID=A0A076VFW4_9CHLO|nr:hypothetical reverse transcriptase [Bracteacoccus minor]AIK29090.1 hypothetical reverse transcriptase [Bracteacoccus minor]